MCACSLYHLTESIMASITALRKELELQYSPTHTTPPPHSSSITHTSLSPHIPPPLFLFLLKTKANHFLFSLKSPCHMQRTSTSVINSNRSSPLNVNTEETRWKEINVPELSRPDRFFSLNGECRKTDLHLDGIEQTQQAGHERTFIWNYFNIFSLLSP